MAGELDAGRDETPLYVDPTETSLAVGRDQTPLAVGRDATPLSVGHEETPLRVGRGEPLAVGRSETPLRIGKTETPLAVGRGETPLYSGPADPRRKMTEARAEGYDWSQISSHLASGSSQAAAEGYTQTEIDNHLGYDTAAFHGGAKQLAASRLAAAPDALEAIQNGDPNLDFGDVRGEYAQALVNGTVKGPRDFADGLAAATLAAAHDVHGLDDSNPGMVRARQAAAQNAADALAPTLPTEPDLIDAALHLSMGDPEPAPFLMQNLLDHWQSTGQKPVAAALAAETNPALNDKLTTPNTPLEPDAAQEAEAEMSRLMVPAIDAWVAGNFEDWKASLSDQYKEQEKIITDAMRETGATSPLDPRVLAKATLDPRGIAAATNMAFATMTNPIEKVGRVVVIDPSKPAGQTVSEMAGERALGPTTPAKMIEPTPVAEGATPSQATIDPAASPAAKIARIIELEHRNLAEDAEFGTGTFFQDLVKKREAEGVLAPDPALNELAEGVDNAYGLRGFLGRLMAAENGAVPLPQFSTPAQTGVRVADRAGRDYMRELLVSTRELGQQEVTHWSHVLEPNWKAISPHLGEWETELAKGPAGAPMNTMIGQMLKYIEGRSAGVTIAADHPLRPVADAIRDAEQAIDAKLRQQAQDRVITYEGFIQDHIRHFWADPAAAERVFLGAGKVGDRSGLRERTIPTYGDGIAKGLMPKYTNPLEGVIQDLRGKILYSHAADMLDIARNDGRLKWSISAPAAGEAAINHGIGRRAVPLEATVDQRAAAATARQQRKAEIAQIRADVHAGIKTQTAGQVETAAVREKYYPLIKSGDATAAISTLQGNEGLVRQINNWLSRGLHANPTTASIADKLMYAKNTTTGFKLIWPAFHAVVEGVGSIASGFGQGMEELARGQFLRAFGNIAESATVAPSIIHNLAVGARARASYINMAGDPIVQMLTEAGLRFDKPRVASLEMQGNTPSVYTSLARNSLLRELGQDVRSIAGDARTETNAYRVLRGVDRTAQFAIKEVGRLMTLMTSPFFDHAIPALKAGAAYRRMQSFLEVNPTASDSVVKKYASQVAKDVDNRMGELNFDTVFWPQAAKQSLNIATISASWAYGSYRGFAAALGLNIDKMALEWNPVATSSLIGTAVAYGYANSLLQYLHTGQAPWQTSTPLKDLINYRTGKTTATGAAVRGMIPSELKEVYDLAKIVMFSIGQPSAAFQGMTTYALAKANPWWQGIHALATGEDAIGHRIANTPGGWPHYLRENFAPIFAEQFEQRRAGTGISKTETAFGFREAAKYVQDPDSYLAGMAGIRDKWTKEELRRAQKENAALENPDPDLPSSTTSRGSYGGTGGARSSSGGQAPRGSYGGTGGARSAPRGNASRPAQRGSHSGTGGSR